MKKAALLVIALAACSTAKDYSGIPDRDVKECEYEAMRATGVSSEGMQYVVPFGPSRAKTAVDLKDRCLELRGYK